MNGWRMRPVLALDESHASLQAAYAKEVRWAQGFRVNNDSRLLLLGMRRLLGQRLLSDAELRTAACVLGCRMGAMDSYETFDDGLLAGNDVPLAFAYALPSIPLACASICHALRGITYTLTGEQDVGIQAFAAAVQLIESGVVDRVVTGCWESPSQTAGDSQSSYRLLLCVIEADACGVAPALPAQHTARDCSTNQDAVAELQRYLRDLALLAQGAGECTTN